MKYKKFETDWDDVPLVIDLPYAARILGVSCTSLRKKSREGKFPAFKVDDSNWRVSKIELQEFIRTGQLTIVDKQTKKRKTYGTDGERTYYHRHG